MEEEPHEEQQHFGRKDKRKMHAILISSVLAKVLVPSPPLPPSAPMPQNNKSNIDLHLDDIAFTFSPPPVVIASTPSNFDF